MNNLFLGVKGHVVCIEKLTGKELWSTKLKGMTITNVYCDSNNIYAHANGHLFCLDTAFGKIQWENKLSGYGYGACIFASNDLNQQQQSSIVMHDQSQKNAQAVHINT